jgi:hypothetical protein
MSAYRRNILTWAIVFAAAMACGSAALWWTGWFTLAFFVVVFASGFALRRNACPKCETPVMYVGSLHGWRFNDGFIHRHCRQCGWDLDVEP